MTAFESPNFSQLWLIILIPTLILAVLGLSWWYFLRRRRPSGIQNSSRKKPEKATVKTKPVQPISLPKNNGLSSSSPILPIKPLSTSSSQLTTTDIAYLDKLVRTASDRSMWKRDNSKEEQRHQLRKVPSGHNQHNI